MASVKGPAPLYEVWVDEERFIASFVYPTDEESKRAASKNVEPRVAPGLYRYASHLHYRLGTLPGAPYTWPDYAAPYFSALRIARDFPGAHVRRSDGVERRDVRMRDPYARHSARHG